MNDLIARLKTKPLPIRRRIAQVTAGAATLLVGLLWLGTSLALGTFGGSKELANATSTAASVGNANVAAAAASQDSAAAPQDTAASLTIVETRSSSTISPDSGDRMIIPF